MARALTRATPRTVAGVDPQPTVWLGSHVTPARRPSRLAATLAVLLAVSVTSHAAALAPATQEALESAKYVYIQSERKTGDLGKAAEIWFLWDDGSVWVGTRPTSWRVKRIRAGRTRARIAVGSPTGPAFDAVGAVVDDRSRQERLMEAFAKRYPDRWPGYAEQFRAGFRSGERVLVRYTPR